MLVGLAEREVTLCSHLLRPLTVLKVGHVTAAVERMLVTRPRVIVYSTTLRDVDAATLKERAQDVGAALIPVFEGMAEADLAPLLLAAANAR